MGGPQVRLEVEVRDLELDRRVEAGTEPPGQQAKRGRLARAIRSEQPQTSPAATSKDRPSTARTPPKSRTSSWTSVTLPTGRAPFDVSAGRGGRSA
jgi:hypothetical protein